MCKIIRLLVEWFFCLHLTVPAKPAITRKWKVDVLTTYCPPEPKGMVIKTLEAIQKINYPHNAYLCAEADDEELKKKCAELGVVYVTRQEKKDAKAGNINNALQTVAKGEISVILDPDHIPSPDFLDEVLPFFEDDKVGFVQVPQVYYNQSETIMAKAAAQQTYQFYGPFMMGLNTFGSVPAIGANCTFRRKALDSIGGHAPGLTEDMHTAMLLHAKKWKSVYNPVVVSKGLVPWNYSGYCVQQLKWAKGTFDLLIRVLPRIGNKLTPAQLLYYLAVPFFYLYGIFAFFDFLIPIIVLITGVLPVKISLFEFFVHLTPLLIATIAIRQFNQKWLFEKHEKGAFILGGTLLKASWWTSILGIGYALINKKVPYIPTPKDFKPENPIRLLLTNFAIIVISVLAIFYGVSKDLNPFLLFMGLLALINSLILLLGTMMAMQKSILNIHNQFQNTFISKGSDTRIWIHERKQILYTFLQKASLPLILVTLLAIFMLVRYENKRLDELALKPFTKGDVFIPNMTGSWFKSLHNDAHFAYDTFRLDDNFLQKAINFSDNLYEQGKIPYFMVNLSDYPGNESSKKHDSLFMELFFHLRETYSPVFFSVVTNKPITDSINNALALQLNNLTVLANKAFFPNVSWVWHSERPYEDPWVEINKYSLSWILTDIKNLSNESSNEPLYPVLAIENGNIKTHDPSRSRETDFNPKIFSKIKPKRAPDTPPVSFPEYVKGIAYNSGHDWRDNRNNLPLTLSKVEKDLEKIKVMGANLIRRYSPSVYDRNILRIATKKEIRVLYGFWFDPKIDYSQNNFRIARYKRQVLRNVNRHKDNPAIVAWSLGNETWGLLKHHYNEPYLSFVRAHYVKMIAELAEEIKQIDPHRPVLTVEEQTPHLSSAVYAFSSFAPHIDVFGVNAYYIENISILDSVMTSANPDMPYLVAEFGPKGYWHEEYNDLIYDTILYEQNSFDKAEFFQYQWENYIFSNQQNNVGGIAFCWQDRYEATATWFGITDIFGNKKPGWFTLKSMFNPTVEHIPFPIPRFRLLMPADNVLPGNDARVVAATSNSQLRESLYYKWFIYEEGSFRKIMETPFEKGNYDFTFKVPNKPSNYRIYVYVSDNDGHVVTESNAILIQWN